jgi:hypothetical protein
VTGDALVDELLRPARLHTADVQPLSAGIGTFVNDTELGSLQISIISGLPFTLSAVQQSWTALAIPVVLITAQLLVLAWLLMFLVTVDVIEARAGEVALAKLRGYQGSRAAVFGLAEPSVLLVVALPIGALIGWLATVGLSRFLLRPGTPVGLPALGWAAAAVAAAGGLAAVGLAARDTLRRPVLEQWRRTAYRPRRRGWVVDAVLLTATSVGLVELLVGGRIGSARRSVLALLVPGLLGLAVAVVAARALPAAGRPLLARTRHGGGVGGFLAVRQLIRRPGAARTTIVLATSFALAAFAVNAFAVGRTNYRTAAEAQVGAPTVLTVSVPGNRDLTSLVDRADPSGRQATAVDELVNTGGGGQVVYAVDPTRFARIAFWRLDFGGGLPDRLARALHPPEPAPVVLRGDALRLTVKVRSLDAAVGVVADVTTTGASGVTPVSLGNLPSRGAVTLTGALVDCPCVLDDLSLNPSPSQTFDTLVGDVVFRHAMVHRQPGWRPVDVGFRAPAHWEAASPTYRSVVSGDPSGLRWRFSVAGADIPAIDSVNRPYPMPVIAASRLTGGRRGRYAGVGLDGNPMAMRVLAAVPAVPGAPAQGLVVDQRYALLAAAGQTSEVTPQVWLAAGAERRVLPQLTAAGVRVLTTATVGGVQRALSRQGPALAGVLFVADAAAAAVLASAGAVLGIYASGRRRRYEYAALVAAGLSRKSLRRGLLTEQLVVLVFGTVVGLGAGVAAVALALRSVPEFVHPPSAPPPAHPIAVGALGVLVGVAVGVLAVSAVVAGLSLIRQVRLEQLREATP